jgi:hypothetical protein
MRECVCESLPFRLGTTDSIGKDLLTACLFVDRSDADFFDDHGDFFDVDHDIGDLEFLDLDDHFSFASDVDVDFEEVLEDSDLED